MIDLPDVNVWLALVDENHTHNRAAIRYWEDQASSRVAFCRLSMLGLLRACTQPRVLSRTLSHQEAWSIYRRYLDIPNILFLPEPKGTEGHFASLTLQVSLPHRLWTDAYLAAFALTSGCRLVSFDSDFTRFPGLHFLHLTP